MSLNTNYSIENKLAKGYTILDAPLYLRVNYETSGLQSFREFYLPRARVLVEGQNVYVDFIGSIGISFMVEADTTIKDYEVVSIVDGIILTYIVNDCTPEADLYTINKLGVVI